MRHTIHQRHMVQQKFYHQHHKYEGYEKEISHYYEFKGSFGIVIINAKQDRKIQSILQQIICYGSE